MRNRGVYARKTRIPPYATVSDSLTHKCASKRARTRVVIHHGASMRRWRYSYMNATMAFQ
eukprot:2692239-Prymnesium_polylepis.1